jgi:2-polyprenyl-3-methyl-5-hydroxy-6-metoxy-1,4-benzoquinol methylase
MHRACFEKGTAEEVTMQITHKKDLGRYYKGIPIHAAPATHEQALALLAKYLKPGSSVLELGAGSGAFALRLHDQGYTVEAVDLDTPDWTLPLIPVYQLDMNYNTWEAFPGKSYDAVVAIETIEHLENPSLFMRNVARLLKPKGIFLLTTPNTVDLDSRRLMLTKGELWMFRRGTLYSTGHLSILPYWLLEEVLSNEGYKILERAFIGKKERRGWRKFVVPFVNLCLLPIGLKLPLKSAFAVSVSFVGILENTIVKENR